jgi:peptidyl-prolyl cis-trans isomerase B (cyclophilin B)
VTSTKDRQRAAARARLEREMAERAEAARRRRRLQLSIAGGVAVLLVAVGTVWLITNALGDDDKGTSANAAPQSCNWINVPADQRTPQTVDVGTPPKDPPRTGSQTLTITTNFGVIEVAMDRSKTPCTSASMAYLAGKKFYDGTKCHRMFEGVLQCGDPSAKGKGYRETDGTGGPSYRFGSENLPTDQRPAYPAGVVAMANSGSPDSNGSQFFVVYKDVQLQPDYTILGRVSKGLDVVEKATAAGDDQAYANSAGGGHPKNDVLLQTVTAS